MAFKLMDRTKILHTAVENGGYECRTDNNSVNMANISTCLKLVSEGLLFHGTTEQDAYDKQVKWFHPTLTGILVDTQEKLAYLINRGKPLSKRKPEILNAKRILEDKPNLASVLNEDILKLIRDYK
ncbi:hypothetical protein [Escherichia phage EP_H11]|nr:hypothetical protein [Escherichia phage EP_H11]